MAENISGAYEKVKTRIVQRLISKRKYDINGTKYTREGVVRVIDELLANGKLLGGSVASMGKAREGIVEHGDDPSDYLTQIANTQKDSERFRNLTAKRGKPYHGRR